MINNILQSTKVISSKLKGSVVMFHSSIFIHIFAVQKNAVIDEYSFKI